MLTSCLSVTHLFQRGVETYPVEFANGEMYVNRDTIKGRDLMFATILELLSEVPVTTIIDYLGVFIGVVAGTIYAIDRKMDTFGAASLGMVTGFGGGVVRDVLLQDQGMFFTQHPMVVLMGIIISMALSKGRKHLSYFYDKLFYLDAFCMAWYVLAGASKCWYAGSGAVISIILGSVTAVGGGACRDICTGEIPRIFLPGKFYGISSLVGAVFYVVPMSLGVPNNVSSVLCVGSGFLLTVLSEHFNWQSHGESAKTELL